MRFCSILVLTTVNLFFCLADAYSADVPSNDLILASVKDQINRFNTAAAIKLYLLERTCAGTGLDCSSYSNWRSEMTVLSTKILKLGEYNKESQYWPAEVCAEIKYLASGAPSISQIIEEEKQKSSVYRDPQVLQQKRYKVYLDKVVGVKVRLMMHKDDFGDWEIIRHPSDSIDDRSSKSLEKVVCSGDIRPPYLSSNTSAALGRPNLEPKEVVKTPKSENIAEVKTPPAPPMSDLQKKQSNTMSDMKKIGFALESYAGTHKSYPETASFEPKIQPYIKHLPKDAWGKPIIYIKYSGGYCLISYGSDGLQGEEKVCPPNTGGNTWNPEDDIVFMNGVFVRKPQGL